MNPQDLIPVPDAIPVHWGWFQLLLIATFILHLLIMNTMLGTGLITLFREFGPKDSGKRLNKEVSEKLPYTVAFAVNLGVAPLLFLQVLYGHFMYTSSILMAVYWLAVVFELILAYYCIYIYDFKFDELGQSRKIFIALGMILLLWVGFMFTNNMTLMMQPEKWARYFTNPLGTLLNLGDPMVVPRYLHFVVASVAVAGLVQAVVRTIWPKGYFSDQDVKSGLKWFLNATCVQFVIGLWFLAALPSDKMILFMGKSVYHTLVLVCGVGLGIASVYFSEKQKVWHTLGTALGTVFFMVLARDGLRRAYLEPYFSLGDLKVVSEYSPMILFLVSLAIGIAVIVYMLKLVVNSKEA